MDPIVPTSIFESKEKQKSDNRINFPLAASYVDALRHKFGDEVRLTYANENSKIVGKELSGYFMSTDQWFRLSALIEFEKKRLKKK